ncbi:MAG: vanadium-dependent haloperoxidase, partial [Chloroflexota bacterium]|nr:vanadium-dependent haloperoxidase [Chloroflexota bacterium]
AMADTVIAVEDARRAAGAGAPAVPSEQAAVAGAAATALGAAFPRAAKLVAGLEREAAEAALWSGTSSRGEIEAGLRLGRAVGELAAAHAAADGADQEWAGTPTTGPGAWQPTPPKFRPRPLEPLAGTWRPWVVTDVVALRPPAPPAWDSPAWRAELAAVQRAVARRTPEQAAAVHHWAGGGGTVTPAGLWVETAWELILRDQLDSLDAARALALATIAMHDAFVCCWDAKYAYWTARPITADPTLDVLIPTPPFPSYTSGHSTISAAAATVLGQLFPADAAGLTTMAREAKDSRLWAGIHFPIDNETGATGGAHIGWLVIAAGEAPAR